MNALLLRGLFSGNKRLIGMCRELHTHRDWLWTFVEHQGIEPTNNTAERALRPAVIWRKTSLGTQSSRGSRFVERLLTCVATLRQRGRNVLDYLTTANEAVLRGAPIPSSVR